MSLPIAFTLLFIGALSLVAVFLFGDWRMLALTAFCGVLVAGTLRG